MSREVTRLDVETVRLARCVAMAKVREGRASEEDRDVIPIFTWFLRRVGGTRRPARIRPDESR